MQNLSKPQSPRHVLELRATLRLCIVATELQGERCLDVRLWRRSEASTDPEDFGSTSAGFVLPVRDAAAFAALLETAAREVQL